MEEPRLINRPLRQLRCDFRQSRLSPRRLREPLGFGPTNDAWIVAAVELGEKAIDTALARVGLTPADISAIFFASVTGIASPTIRRPPHQPHALPHQHQAARPSSALAASPVPPASPAPPTTSAPSPNQYALLLSVELCSLTWQDNDQSIANLISCGLFGDGAAAVIVAGSETALAKRTCATCISGPKILDTRSTFYRHTEHIMGLGHRRHGLQNIVLSPDVPKVVNEHLRGNVESFLTDNGLSLDDISSYIFHFRRT